MVRLWQHPIAVRVHVDEAGRDHLAGAVDHTRRGRIGELADGSDAAVAHGHAARQPVTAGAIEDGSIAQHELEHGGFRIHHNGATDTKTIYGGPYSPAA